MQVCALRAVPGMISWSIFNLVPNHPWFVACQFHPEFTSTPRDGHPLFAGFVKAASEFQKRQAK